MDLSDIDTDDGFDDIPAYSPSVLSKIPIMPTTREMAESPLRTSPASDITSSEADLALNDSVTSSKAQDRSGKHHTSSRTTVIELVSTNATSSAFPESFGLSISTTGRWMAACSSSALYLISVVHLPKYKETCRTFRIRRKPLAVAVTENGRFAVLTTSHKIDVYQCGEESGDFLTGPCRKLETIYLDNEARILAFSRCGEVVAAGSDAGVEIKNLSPGCLETDKRQINCATADHLVFSKDGRSLLTTSTIKKSRYSTFISVSEAFEDAFAQEEVEQQPLGKVWITQLLFPERLVARQASLLPGSSDNLINTEILGFDVNSDRYRIFDVTMKRFVERELGLPEGESWSRSDKAEDALPAIASDGDSMAIAIRRKSHKEIWIYSVPSSWWDAQETDTPESENEEVNHYGLIPTRNIKLPQREDGAPPETITCMQWLESKDASFDRLVALVSTVNMAMPEEVVAIEEPAASAKILLFDFSTDSPISELDNPIETIVVDLSEISLSEGLADEMLELDREVDIVRRRTQVQRRRPDINILPSPRGSLRRSVSSGSTSGGVPTLRDVTRSDSSGARSARRRRSFSSMSSMSEEADIGPIGAIDEPYSQTQPRSQFSLQRAATIAANAPANRHHLRALPSRPLEYRRADGMREMPHESDADNWVPPPPPYSEEPDNAMSHPISTNPHTGDTYLPNTAQRPRPNRLQRPSSPTAIPQVPTMRRAMNSLRTVSSPAIPGHAPSRSMSSTVAITSIPRRPLNRDSLISPRRPTVDTGVAPAPRSARISLVDPALPRHGRQSSNNSSIHSTPAVPPIPASFQTPEPPPSPMTPYISPARDSPVPESPTVDQLESLHRRSGSGGVAPRTARGAHTASHPRRVVSAELMRPLPTASQERVSTPAGDDTRRSPGGRRQRPMLTRLATIASITSHHRADDPPPEQGTQSAHTTPETPTSRRQWWRIGHREMVQQARPDSRMLPLRPPQHAATALVGSKVSKEKDGTMKCVVM